MAALVWAEISDFGADFEAGREIVFEDALNKGVNFADGIDFESIISHVKGDYMRGMKIGNAKKRGDFKFGFSRGLADVIILF